MSKDLNEFQNIIGYHFLNEELLIQALTHTSKANEAGIGHLGSNERIEFLGDAVLELVSSKFFYEKYPDLEEGELTKKRASFVCEPSLCLAAEDIRLKEYILLGKGEEATGGRERPSIISDAFESVIGAIYLDGGYEPASDFILRFVLSNLEENELFYDSKTLLQEYARKANVEPKYVLISEEGPAHNKKFTVIVQIDDIEYGTGTGQNKKAAEQNAAYEALKKLNEVRK